MKTTIETPDPLHKRAKIRAVAASLTLRQLLLESLERHLANPHHSDSTPSCRAHRKLRPGFQRLLESGSLDGGTNSATMISGERALATKMHRDAPLLRYQLSLPALLH